MCMCVHVCLRVCVRARACVCVVNTTPCSPSLQSCKLCAAVSHGYIDLHKKVRMLFGQISLSVFSVSLHAYLRCHMSIQTVDMYVCMHVHIHACKYM